MPARGAVFRQAGSKQFDPTRKIGYVKEAKPLTPNRKTTLPAAYLRGKV